LVSWTDVDVDAVVESETKRGMGGRVVCLPVVVVVLAVVGAVVGAETVSANAHVDVDVDAVVDLTAETFDAATSSGLWFVKFYAPWCGHCHALEPTWRALAASSAADEGGRQGGGVGPLRVARIDCTEAKSVCEAQHVRGYPTLRLIAAGRPLPAYRGDRSLEALKAVVARAQQLPVRELASAGELEAAAAGGAPVFVLLRASTSAAASAPAGVEKAFRALAAEQHMSVAFVSIDGTAQDVLARLRLDEARVVLPSVVVVKDGHTVVFHAALFRGDANAALREWFDRERWPSLVALDRDNVETVIAAHTRVVFGVHSSTASKSSVAEFLAAMREASYEGYRFPNTVFTTVAFESFSPFFTSEFGLSAGDLPSVVMWDTETHEYWPAGHLSGDQVTKGWILDFVSDSHKNVIPVRRGMSMLAERAVLCTGMQSQGGKGLWPTLMRV
jgi:thiol-disulfide isomerase/thioredoxin